VHERDFPDAFWAETGILSDTLVEALASAGPIDTIDSLKELIGNQWRWYEDYGEELLTVLKSIPHDPIPEAPALPTVQKRGKRKEREDVGSGDGDGERQEAAAPRAQPSTLTATSTLTSTSTPLRPSTSFAPNASSTPTQLYSYPSFQGYHHHGSQYSAPYAHPHFYYPSPMPTPVPASYWQYCQYPTQLSSPYYPQLGVNPSNVSAEANRNDIH
jgi:hypothetical protein